MSLTGLYSAGTPNCAEGVDDRLQEFLIKLGDIGRNTRAVTAQDELEEQLLPIQVNRSSANFPAEDRDIILAGKFQVDLLLGILVIADADVRRGRAQDKQGFAPQVGGSMVKRLAVFPGYGI